MLMRRVVDGRVYYKSKQQPLFEARPDELIGVSE
jgi:hypothetical protein